MKDYTGILFLDIETVPLVEHFEELDERLQLLFKKKFKKEINDLEVVLLMDSPNVAHSIDYEVGMKKACVGKVWSEKAALHAEFGKVVCISVGTFVRDGGQMTGEQKFHVEAITELGRVTRIPADTSHINKSWSSAEIREELERIYKKHGRPTLELAVLDELKEIIKKTNPSKIVTHNGKNFDIPFLCRRNIINAGIPMPGVINPIGKKPWEIQHDDTMEMWGFGEWGKKTSLDLISATLGIPSPKEIMDGSQVSYYYYQHDLFHCNNAPDMSHTGISNLREPFQKGIEKIGQYCNGDVITLAKVYLRLCGDLDEVVLLNP